MIRDFLPMVLIPVATALVLLLGGCYAPLYRADRAASAQAEAEIAERTTRMRVRIACGDGPYYIAEHLGGATSTPRNRYVVCEGGTWAPL